MKKNVFFFLIQFITVATYSQWQNGTGITYYNPLNTKVGVGIATPSEILHLNNGSLKIGNASDSISRSLNMLKFGDGNYVKIGEWEVDDKLSFYAKNGFNFSGSGLFVNNGSISSVIGISAGSGNNRPGNPRIVLHQRWDIPHAYVYYNQNLYFHADGSTYNPLVLEYNGSVGIGFPEGYTSGKTHTGGYKLAVNGSVHAKSIDVDMIGWPDYVFKQDYKLISLNELESFIATNKHLPGIPSQIDIESKGKINLGETQALLLQKIEELTLYLIEIKKENEILKKDIEQLQEKMKKNEK